MLSGPRSLLPWVQKWCRFRQTGSSATRKGLTPCERDRKRCIRFVLQVLAQVIRLFPMPASFLIPAPVKGKRSSGYSPINPLGERERSKEHELHGKIPKGRK